MNSFYKVTYTQYYEATGQEYSLDDYNELKLPHRATALSAGYDFFAPHDIYLLPGHDIIVPTGIGIKLDPNKFLMLVIRSGFGFKYHLGLANQVGIVDADFTNSDSGGHIMAKLVNNGGRPVEIKKGQAFMQGIILPFYKVFDDDAEGERTGGFGSTDKEGENI